MSAITLKFEGALEKVLSALTKSGLFASKSEAIRYSILRTALDFDLVDNKTLLEELRRELAKKPMTVEEIMEGIEHVKRTTVRR